MILDVTQRDWNGTLCVTPSEHPLFAYCVGSDNVQYAALSGALCFTSETFPLYDMYMLLRRTNFGNRLTTYDIAMHVLFDWLETVVDNQYKPHRRPLFAKVPAVVPCMFDSGQIPGCI